MYISKSPLKGSVVGDTSLFFFAVLSDRFRRPICRDIVNKGKLPPVSVFAVVIAKMLGVIIGQGWRHDQPFTRVASVLHRLHFSLL